jgi:Mg-chelatase subunit ChlD
MSNSTPTPTYPREAYCPITMDIMKDPVSGNQGEVFERSAITEWVTEHKCSPITRQPLELSDLRPNLPLRSIIEDITKQRAQFQQKSTVKSQIADVNSLQNFPIITPKLEAQVLGNMLRCSVTYADEELKKIKQTVPVNIIANVDVSASMEGPSSKNNNEGAQWSILSLVQHSLITTIKGLNERCKFGIVTFSAASKLKFPPTYMTEDMKTKAIACVNLLCGERNTNLYAGIKRSYEVAKEYNLTNPTILTFTDGISNNDPPSGLIPAIEKYKSDKNMSGQMHIIGFGSDLKTMDLYNISNIVGGRFDYISDFSMVGTVFVNLVTNTLLQATLEDKIEVYCLKNMFGYNKNNIEKMYCPYENDNEKYTIHTQSILYGQTRDFFIKFVSPITASTSPTIIYKPTNQMLHSGNEFPITILSEENKEAHGNFLSEFLIATVYDELISSMNESQLFRKESIAVFIYGLQSVHSEFTLIKDTEIFKNVLADLENEVLQGFDNQGTYRQWGQKYACAYVKALEFQQSNNFKDKVMSHFTSEYSEKIREDIEEIFMDIEAPKTRENRVVDRKTFTNISYNCGGGCVSCDTPLFVKRGDHIRSVVASKIQPGDKVLTYDSHIYNFTLVIFVVVQNYDSYMIEMPNNIKITPWHPMYDQNHEKYVFPEYCEQGEKLEHENEFKTVYNFVVENRKNIVVGNKWLREMVSDIQPNEIDITTMISLGHGITNDEVASHDYLGTEKVVDDLYKLREEQGTNRVLVSKEKRDQSTNRVCKYL